MGLVALVCTSLVQPDPISQGNCLETLHRTICPRLKWVVLAGVYASLVPRLSKSARGGEEAESLVSAVYACASFTQILGKPYSVRASSVSKTSSLEM